MLGKFLSVTTKSLLELNDSVILIGETDVNSLFGGMISSWPL